VRSVNGPQFTAIDGGKSIRCAYLADGTALSGFTLTNGLASYGSYAYGGGVLCQSLAAVVSNCVVAGNSATGYGEGGGAYGGTLNNCTLTSNSVTGLGGGAYYCTLNNCTLAGNSAAFGGGGGG